MLRELKKLIDAGRRVGLVDLGASGGLEPRWKQVETCIDTFRFEPDMRSAGSMVQASESDRVFTVALDSSSGERSFFLCRKPQTSSFLLPNMEFISRFQDASRFEVVDEQRIVASTLDDIMLPHARQVDFLKLDTQGSELAILTGGEDLLSKEIIGLEVEVEFLELYRGQPLFGDVCKYLSGYGYEFMDFVSLCRWERRGYTNYGQLVFGDALFLRSPEYFASLIDAADAGYAREKVLAYIFIVSLYDRVDLVELSKRVFGRYITREDLGRVEAIILKLNRRRSAASVALDMGTRIFRLFGQRVFTFQSR